MQSHVHPSLGKENILDSNTWYVMKPIPIQYENADEITHVAPYFLCGKPDCPCHRDPELSGAVMAEFMDGLLTVDEAFAIYWGRV